MCRPHAWFGPIDSVANASSGTGSAVLPAQQVGAPAASNAHAALSIADVGFVLETCTVGLSGPGHELLANEQVKAAYLGM